MKSEKEVRGLLKDLQKEIDDLDREDETFSSWFAACITLKWVLGEWPPTKKENHELHHPPKNN
ncbi:hypothetical protein KA005_30460 [bacterium]|nr:hypothetical protein [bacterium]